MPANPRTEVVALAVTLLDAAPPAGWDSANTGGLKPVIVDDAEGSRRGKGAAGLVTVFGHGPYRRERVDGPGVFRDHKTNVTIKVHARTRAKLDELLGEIERIHNNVQDNPEGGPGPAQHWDWIEDLGESQQADYPGNFRTHVEWEFWATSIVAAT